MSHAEILRYLGFKKESLFIELFRYLGLTNESDFIELKSSKRRGAEKLLRLKAKGRGLKVDLHRMVNNNSFLCSSLYRTSRRFGPSRARGGKGRLGVVAKSLTSGSNELK
ncbi:unnamed protein product [Ectocarpus sp. 4 AP-2014]